MSTKGEIRVQLHGIVANIVSHRSVCTHVARSFVAVSVDFWQKHLTHLLFPQAFADELGDSIEQHPEGILLMLIEVVVLFSRRRLCCTCYQTENNANKFQTCFQYVCPLFSYWNFDISIYCSSCSGDHRLREGATCFLRLAER